VISFPDFCPDFGQANAGIPINYPLSGMKCSSGALKLDVPWMLPFTMLGVGDLRRFPARPSENSCRAGRSGTPPGGLFG